MGTQEREYEFFVTTDKPHQPEGTDRGLIRRLVMRNFFEAKGAEPQINISEHHSATTVLAKKQLKSRFRLSKVEEHKIGVKSRRRDCIEGTDTAKRTRSRPLRTLSSGTNGSDLVQGDASMTSGPKRVPKHDEHLGGEKRNDDRALLKTNPGAHRFDPFDVLPVPGTPQLDMLFKLYRSVPKANSIAVNAKRSWWPFISNDAGLLHATLATWALYGMLVRGLNELWVDKLRHKNEAIKEINLKIGSPGGVITDELVGTVLTMASFENLLGAYDAAQLHVAALKRMVNARGGLLTFGHNDGLIRGIAWVDFHNAVVFHTSTSFPRIRFDSDTLPLPDKLLEEAACTSPTSLLQLSVSGIDCFNIFYRLHRLALAASSHWVDKVDRLTSSNLLYEVEYIILSVPDYSRDFLDFDFDAADKQDKDYDGKQTAAHAASIVEALLAASQIFVYAALRALPTNAKIFTILLERLHVAVTRPTVCTIHVWKIERNVNMLLWTLVVACSVAPPGDGRGWWIHQLMDVMTEMDVKSRFDLEVALHGVAWVDTYFHSVLSEIWGEVLQESRVGQGTEI
ncbi:hypothetical protein CC86DRAFT_397570 [Ophiobolus disseminans]|uniref:Tachykinin family protein n=1 Tax=Ophiobolus disseminans TaxID=1469910 RepID=A0A6A6ZLG4_9PLEO|nr:hypothetical protein CC86DRAFT_397570 [Ophiobolus disseminans]